MPSVSVIIPVYNEEGNITELYKEVKEVCVQNLYDYEIIIINDGSDDKSGEFAKSLSPLKYIEFRKNYGQTAAIDAGIKNATKEYIITMDGDRQNDPKDIPNLIGYLEQNNLDVVSGWRKNRKDPFLKKFISRGANLLRKIIIHDKIHDSGCSLKIYRSECFKNLSFYGEMHRFIPAVLEMKGFTVGEIVVNHRERVAGRTKYNWRRTIKGFLDMTALRFWNKYSARPLHLLGGLGLIFIFFSFISGLATVYSFILGQGMSETAWPVLTTFFFLSGIQLFISGLITDILLKSYFENTKNLPYSIRKIVEN